MPEQKTKAATSGAPCDAHPGSAPLKIDAHHHLWRYSQQDYGWITDDMQAIRRDFLLPDLAAELKPAGVHGTVAVQARQSVEETEWLLQMAAQPGSPLLGVVGWLPLTSSDLPIWLDRFGHASRLKGLRHVVQGEPAGFMDSASFRQGMARIQSSELVYDILIYAHQMQEATRLVDRFPRQRFVLDHIGKPNLRTGETGSWCHDLRTLAARPNVACKLSGMVTEAHPQDWTVAQLQPYAELVLEAFGAGRVMAGTDWPVLTVGCDYARWWQIVEHWIDALTETEQAAILGGNAARWYALDRSMPGGPVP